MADQPTPLMPHATATWLVDNTALSFEQIAQFCGLHILEVQAMADDLAGSKYTGRDPVHAGELTHEEIEMGQADPSYALKMHKAPLAVNRTKGPRYTPVSKRQDKPDGIAWILRNHPEVTDAQISKLLGTTKATIESIRNRTHWNSGGIKPVDPVTLRQYLDITTTMNPEPELHLQPHPEAPYEMVDEVLAITKRAQITKMGFVGNEAYATW